MDKLYDYYHDELVKRELPDPKEHVLTVESPIELNGAQLGVIASVGRAHASFLSNSPANPIAIGHRLYSSKGFPKLES